MWRCVGRGCLLAAFTTQAAWHWRIGVIGEHVTEIASPNRISCIPVQQMHNRVRNTGLLTRVIRADALSQTLTLCLAAEVQATTVGNRFIRKESDKRTQSMRLKTPSGQTHSITAQQECTLKHVRPCQPRREHQHPCCPPALPRQPQPHRKLLPPAAWPAAPSMHQPCRP